ncbi:hypothetical protein FOL47_003749, partial [Perkinsus chesapeaki]
KARCYEYGIINDVMDAYMRLWLLPSNRKYFTVNITPFEATPTWCEFWCLPYGPSHCPRVLELCLQWLVQHNFRPNPMFEIQSYMDDLVIFSHKGDIDVELQLRELCGSYDLNLKPTKRQVLTEGDVKMLGVMLIDNGRYITIPTEKLDKLKLKMVDERSTYARLLGVLGLLDESPAAPAWALAIKHACQSLVAKERAKKGLPWSAECSSDLRDIVNAWQTMITSMPASDFVVPRLYDYGKPLDVYTDASKRAGGFIFKQNETILLQRVHRRIPYIEPLQWFTRLNWQVTETFDNVDVEATFRA